MSPYKDPQKRKEHDKKYQEKNKGRIAKQRKIWENNNQEYMKEYRRKYYHKNKEKHLKYNQEYYRKNKKRINNQNTKTANLRRKNNPQIQKKESLRAKDRYNTKKEKCIKCGSTEELQLHHICYEPSIFIVVCEECHLKIHGKKLRREKK